jgi:predicted tellurium resistance membrane protein TerC
MKKQKQQSVTSLPPSPDEERHSRMLKYTIMMVIRLICVILAIVFTEWWRWLFVVGAVLLPYIAVVIANTVISPASTAVQSPGGVVVVPERRPDDEQ